MHRQRVHILVNGVAWLYSFRHSAGATFKLLHWLHNKSNLVRMVKTCRFDPDLAHWAITLNIKLNFNPQGTPQGRWNLTSEGRNFPNKQWRGANLIKCHLTKYQTSTPCMRGVSCTYRLTCSIVSFYCSERGKFRDVPRYDFNGRVTTDYPIILIDRWNDNSNELQKIRWAIRNKIAWPSKYQRKTLTCLKTCISPIRSVLSNVCFRESLVGGDYTLQFDKHFKDLTFNKARLHKE